MQAPWWCLQGSDCTFPPGCKTPGAAPGLGTLRGMAWAVPAPHPGEKQSLPGWGWEDSGVKNGAWGGIQSWLAPKLAVLAAPSASPRKTPGVKDRGAGLLRSAQQPLLVEFITAFY